jgi:hypothetical protein
MSAADKKASGWVMLSKTASALVSGQGSGFTKLIRLYKLANKQLVIHADDVAALCQEGLPSSIRDLKLSFRDQHILVDVLVSQVATHRWASAFLLRSCDTNGARKSLAFEQAGSARIKPVGFVATLARFSPRMAAAMFPQIGFVLGIVLKRMVRVLVSQVVDASVESAASESAGLRRAGAMWSLESDAGTTDESGLCTRLHIPGLGDRLVLGEVLLIKKVALVEDEARIDFEIHPAVAAFVSSMTSMALGAIRRGGADEGEGDEDTGSETQEALSTSMQEEATEATEAENKPETYVPDDPVEVEKGHQAAEGALAEPETPEGPPPAAPSWLDRISAAAKTFEATVEHLAQEAEKHLETAETLISQVTQEAEAGMDSVRVAAERVRVESEAASDGAEAVAMADSAAFAWNEELLTLDVLSPEDLAPELFADFDFTDLSDFFEG